MGDRACCIASIARTPTRHSRTAFLHSCPPPVPRGLGAMDGGTPHTCRICSSMTRSRYLVHLVYTALGSARAMCRHSVLAQCLRSSKRACSSPPNLSSVCTLLHAPRAVVSLSPRSPVLEVAYCSRNSSLPTGTPSTTMPAGSLPRSGLPTITGNVSGLTPPARIASTISCRVKDEQMI